MRVYEHCNEFPLSRFITCLCDNDYSVMLIDGEATEEELQQAWAKIYDEYLDLTSKNNNNEFLFLWNEYESLFYKHTVIEQCVELLKWWHDENLVGILKQHGYNFPFNPEDTERYWKDLERVVTRSKKLLLDMKVRKEQLDAIQSASSGAKIDRNYFDTILVVLSKFSQYHIDEEKTTVGRYVNMLNLYITHCRQLTNKANGGSDR